MAVYKVPQDVEADDKLIGPFSFRQFIYLIVVAISIAGAWGLSQVFIPLAIIPLPFIVFFAALALPLRKDQPMETYLSAVVSFYFMKSRKRFWIPDGIDSFVTIIPPKDADKILTKQFGEDEATRRLGYLADLVDSHGWSVRGAGVPVPDTSLSNDLYYETQQTPDMLDNDTSEAVSLDQKLQASNDNFHQNAIAQMQQTNASPVTSPMTAAAQSNPLIAGVPTTTALPKTDSYTPATPFNPMAQPTPASVSQTTQSYLSKDQLDAVAYAAALTEEAEDSRSGISRDTAVATPIAPQKASESAPSTSATTTPDATMERAKERAKELATRDDISIQTLSEEANRLEKKDKVLTNGDEVTISLR
jgi:hypothetical protein